MARPPDNHQPGAMPMMIYGTAWKKEKTAELVYEAIKAGFRGIDSGVGPHYNEPGVGEGLRRAFEEGIVRREDLWIQTKISSLDERFPDDDMKSRYPHLEPRIGRVIASALQSLDGLFHSSSSSSSPDTNQESYIDAVLFHEAHAYQPREMLAISNELEAQSLLPHKIRSLGACNTSLSQLESLERSGITPSIVQNPFSMHGAEEFDASVRRWCCRSKNQSSSTTSPENLQFTGADDQLYQRTDNHNHGGGVMYQAFHTLTSNKTIWENAPYITKLSTLVNVPKQVVWYSLLISAGMVVLNGTSTPQHMKADLEGLKVIWRWRRDEHTTTTQNNENKKIWDLCRGVFLDAIDGDMDSEEE